MRAATPRHGGSNGLDETGGTGAGPSSNTAHISQPPNPLRQVGPHARQRPTIFRDWWYRCDIRLPTGNLLRRLVGREVKHFCVRTRATFREKIVELENFKFHIFTPGHLIPAQEEPIAATLVHL